MRERPAPASRASAVRNACNVDVMILTPHGRHLAVLVAHGAPIRGREVVTLPWTTLRAADALDDVGRHVARAHLGQEPGWIAQVGAFGGGTNHPSGAPVCRFGFIAIAWRLWRQGGNRLAYGLYRYSSMYLALIFAAMVVDTLLQA